MNNRIMAKLLGEDDVSPVMANVPRATYRNRMLKRKAPDSETENGSVSRMVRESSEDSTDSENEDIIPKDAKSISSVEMSVGKPIHTPKDVVQEPSYPQAEKEKYMTPYSALTAPDVTPQSSQPIDPSQIPGASGPERFTALDLEQANPVEQPDVSKTMDILLGRNRSKPALKPEEFEQAGAITTEEAAAMLGISTPLQEHASSKAAGMLVSARDGGSAMPDPVPASDGSKIYSAFRRFNG